FFLLFYILEKRIGRLDRFKIKNSFLKVMLATFIASLTIEFLKIKLPLNMLEYLRIFIIGIFSWLVYFLSCFILKVEELEFIFSKWNLKRR
ncbi:MAG: hypothetical protein NC900_04845, partial [Candidatus Omnitrophica bacterium]|nr:hypothetical protein [Candidatus Omnitrophota bacterium]